LARHCEGKQDLQAIRQTANARQRRADSTVAIPGAARCGKTGKPLKETQ